MGKCSSVSALDLFGALHDWHTGRWAMTSAISFFGEKGNKKRRRHNTSSLRWPGWLYACKAAMTAHTKHWGTTSFPLHLIFPLYKAQFGTYSPFCNCLYTEDH